MFNLLNEKLLNRHANRFRRNAAYPRPECLGKYVYWNATEKLVGFTIMRSGVGLGWDPVRDSKWQGWEGLGNQYFIRLSRHQFCSKYCWRFMWSIINIEFSRDHFRRPKQNFGRLTQFARDWNFFQALSSNWIEIFFKD